MVSGKLYIKDNSGNVQELKIDKERTVEFIRGTQTAAGAALTGVTEDSALYDGKTIFYYLPFAAASNATLNLTLSDETTTGAKPVFVTATTRLGTHYGAGSVISLTYLADKDGWYRSDYWNSNTYDRTYLNSPIKAATAVTAGTIIVGTASGYKMVASGVTFDLSYPILYASAAMAAAATNNATYLEIPNVNLQTTKASWTGANNSIVYIVGTLSGNTVTIDSTVFTTTVPTSDDSKVYVPFGIMTSTTACYLMPMDGVYAFRNGSFGPLEQKVTVTGSGNAVTAITATNGVITATKGVTFATNGHTHTYPSLSVTTSGTGNVVDGLSVNNHAITLSKATTALLSATVSGTGNGITTASYANGVLTLTKGLTFSTNGHSHTETQLSLATSGTGNGIADLSVSNHTITMTKTNFTTGVIPNIPNLSISTSGTGNGISAVSVSGHAITITKAEFTTGPHPTVPTIPAITVATTGSGDAIIGLSATNHAITVTKGGSWSPSSHGLSATSTGAGNAFDTITVSNHSITMGKTTTFATTHSHPYLPLAGGTMTGNIVMSGYKNITLDISGTTPTINTTRDVPIVIKTKDTDNNFVFESKPFFEIPVSQTSNYGMGIGIGAGGLTIIGGGESARAIVAADTLGGTAEKLVLTSDNEIEFQTKCNTIGNRVKRVIDTNGNFDGNAANVTGTVAIDHGGTGQTTRLNALKALTNESVGTSANYFLTITTSWGKGGYTSVADAKTVLGLKSAAYEESSAFATATHTHSYLPLTGGTITGSLIRKNTGKTRGTAPTANVNAVEIYGQDNAGKTTWGLYNTYSTARQNQVQLIAYSGITTDNTWAGIGVGYDASGNVFTNAPNPAASDSSSKIATTKFVKDQGYLTTQTQLSISTSTHGGNAVTGVSVSNHAITITKGSTFLTSQTQLSVSTSGSGNCVSALTVSNHAITITKGITALTSHQSLSGYVPTSRTVNGKALSANISLTAADVGALASTGKAANSTLWNGHPFGWGTGAKTAGATDTANASMIYFQYVN